MPHSISPASSPSRQEDDVELPYALHHQDQETRSSQETSPAVHEPTQIPAHIKDDMFDEEETDDEFNSSASNLKSDGISPDGNSIPGGSKYSDPEIMRAYYQRLFPFRPLFQWLNHSPVPTTDFLHRELAFTLPGDIYLRYQSFQTADLLRQQCIKMIPSRFEIGPVYSTNPRDRKTLRNASAFKPLQKELVFDVDLTDYDPIRTCCKEANICRKCWIWATMAIKVMDTALREDFGFKHILWVYSGRRGVHAWVCDKRAREMDDSKRKAVAGYLELLRGRRKGDVRKGLLHPHLERSLRILQEHFQSDILSGQDPWLEEPEELIRMIPDTGLTSALKKKWDSAGPRSSSAKWADINTVFQSGASGALDDRGRKHAMQDIVLEYTYPRLDAEVSKKLNHLLKAPFCVHPGTGRVCVPIDARRVDEFDPFAVPTVTELLGQIDGWDKENEGGGDGEEKRKKIADYEKTSLKSYVEYFKGFVAELLREERGGKRGKEQEDGGGDAMEF